MAEFPQAMVVLVCYDLPIGIGPSPGAKHQRLGNLWISDVCFVKRWFCGEKWKINGDEKWDIHEFYGDLTRKNGGIHEDIVEYKGDDLHV